MPLQTSPESRGEQSQTRREMPNSLKGLTLAFGAALVMIGCVDLAQFARARGGYDKCEWKLALENGLRLQGMTGANGDCVATLMDTDRGEETTANYNYRTPLGVDCHNVEVDFGEGNWARSIVFQGRCGWIIRYNGEEVAFSM